MTPASNAPENQTPDKTTDQTTEAPAPTFKLVSKPAADAPLADGGTITTSKKPRKAHKKADDAAPDATKPSASHAEGAKFVGKVRFVSRHREPSMFDVCSYRPIRNQSTGCLEFYVDPDDADRFAVHHHVASGRIVRAQ